MDQEKMLYYARKRRRRRTRNRLLIALACLLVVAAVVLGLSFLLRGCPAKKPASAETESLSASASLPPAHASVSDSAGVSSPTETSDSETDVVTEPVSPVPGTVDEPTAPELTQATEPAVPTEPTPPEPSYTEAPPEPSYTEAPPEPSEPEPSGTEPTVPEPVEDESWKLLLVNADHPLPEGFTVKLKTLRNDQQVDERIYPELQQMFDDARAVGIFPFINESFRTAERQQQIMDKYIRNYESQGMSHDEAVRKARETVALPGTSEHQLGLALDIIAENSGDSTSTWQWLKENSWRYGFILRYPADKVALTGISYEPWHFRYVGVSAAREITEQGLCLEEYVARSGG